MSGSVNFNSKTGTDESDGAKRRKGEMANRRIVKLSIKI